MNKQLQKRFNELLELYKENAHNIEQYLAAHENADILHANASQTAQKQISEHYLFNASLKKRIDDALKDIELELQKNETDINYSAYTDKLKSTEQSVQELIENIKPTWKKVTDSFFFQLLVVFLLKTFIFGWYCVPNRICRTNSSGRLS